mmetsp:Transcript_11522/g.20722  ORF Transcript_11522/g.20722 Transcript_11522/m.20722 type:complete len:194 (+) Transcript_11522:78-659(+)|eukprot:CAMPEP_0201640998 /NCGR_PEP_ID=MMETSP0493-20130528/23113_1 /ASSEMBLY_ACC=CAM_ASM_000838 /TAXON_ID=420259 /ORGANISM="Thalassiosira gravida, Strain GMp14c1" /LENGTH=193 /DNA_ID=CAMNT_0048114817 /DNA_START=44 /DNA_END=625 /DNA_ORIENTATION=-
MKQSTPSLCCAALACLSSNSIVEAFAPSTSGQTIQQQRTSAPSRQSPKTSLNLWLPDAADHTLLTSAASSLIATIDSDIANIPDDEFGKVFAGGGIIIFGSILSTIFVGFLIESGGGGYADLVAETYAEQNMGEDEESYLNSLGLGEKEKKETEDMVRAFREKKMKKAGKWTEEDESKKQQLIEEKDMFSDYE